MFAGELETDVQKKKKKEKELQRLLALPFALQCESGYKLSIYFEYIKEAYHYHYLWSS